MSSVYKLADEMDFVTYLRASEFRNPAMVPAPVSNVLDTADAMVRTVARPLYPHSQGRVATVEFRRGGRIILSIQDYGHFHGNTLADAINAAVAEMQDAGRATFDWSAA